MIMYDYACLKEGRYQYVGFGLCAMLVI